MVVRMTYHKKISRCICEEYTIENGTMFWFLEHKNKVQGFLTLQQAEDYRRQYDFEKSRWTTIGLNGRVDAGTTWHSKVMQDYNTYKYYVECVCPDDIIVSNICDSRDKAYEVKEYLDKNNWHVRALNTFKKDKKVTRKYSGIIPLKGNRYMIQDADRNRHGIYDNIEEALMKRDALRAEGILI